MKTLIVLALLLCVGCTYRRHKAPPHTWWKGDALVNSAYLISDDGEKIAAYINPEAWLYKCYNTNPVFRTPDEAVRAVVACGVQYTKERHTDSARAK